MFIEHINTGVVKCCTFLMVHCKAKHKKLIWFTPPALNVIINFFFWNSFNRTVLQHSRCLLWCISNIFKYSEGLKNAMIRWFALTNVCTLCWPTIVKFIFDWHFFKWGREKGGKGVRELFLSFKISMWYRFITCFWIFSPIRWFIPKRDGCCVICLMVSWEGNRKSYSVLQYLTRHSPSGDIRFSVIYTSIIGIFVCWKRSWKYLWTNLFEDKTKKGEPQLFICIELSDSYFSFSLQAKSGNCILCKFRMIGILGSQPQTFDNNTNNDFHSNVYLLQDSWVKEWNGAAWILRISLLWWCAVRSETYTCKYWLQLIITDSITVLKWFKL